MTMQLLVNDVFEAMQVRYRLLHAEPTCNAAYVLPLQDPHPTPECWKLDELATLVETPGELKVLPQSQDSERPPKARERDIRTRDARWECIKDLVQRKDGTPDPALWDPERRRDLIKAHAARRRISVKSLTRFLRLYWQGGQTIDALLGDHWKCGRVSEDTEGALVVNEKSRNGPMQVVFAPVPNPGRSRGRRPKDGKHGNLALPAPMRNTILEFAKQHYLADASKTVYGTTIAVLDELFCQRDASGQPLRDSKGAAMLNPPGLRPSFYQVRHLLRKAIPLSKAFVARNSVAEYENNHAPSSGSVLDDCLGPGDAFEIDSTVLDAYVVARANRAQILGKPTLYLVIDRWSRLIVGFYLSLEPPSWSEARQAILSIGGDWEALCKRLDVTYDAKDWPARSVKPNRFVADRGDMISFASDLVCDGMNTQVVNARALFSADKAIVESGFICVHAPLRQDAPGYEPPKNVFKRRAKKYHKDACLTLDEMAAVLLRSCIHHNRTQKRGYQQLPEEILNNASVSPIDIWNRHVATRMGVLSRLPIDLLRRKLLPKGIAVVKVDGIHFNGLIYKADERIVGEWHVRASVHRQFEVQASYNPSLVDNILVTDEADDRKQYTLRLTTTSEEYAGYSFAEVKFVMDRAAEKARAADKENEAHAVATRQDIRALAQRAGVLTKDASVGLTPGQRKSGGEEAAAVEARERRRMVNRLEGTPLQYASPGADSDPQEPVPPVQAATATPGTAVPTESSQGIEQDEPTDSDVPSTSPEVLDELSALMQPTPATPRGDNN